MSEGMGRLVCSTGCTKQCHLCPKISKFWAAFISGWPGLPYNWYMSFCYFYLLEPYCLHRASNHPVISKLMCTFYLQHPPSCNCFDPWDVEHLLSLLKSWASAFSLTTFKLAWKTATLLALVTVKHCFDLTLSCIDNQHLFLQHHAAISVSLSGGKMGHLGHLPLIFILSLVPKLIFALFFFI